MPGQRTVCSGKSGISIDAVEVVTQLGNSKHPPVVATGGSSAFRSGQVRSVRAAPGAPSSSAVRKLEPQPQAATAFGLLTVKPAPMSVST